MMGILMSKPNSRAEAKKLGSLHYATGVECKYGHISDRLTSTGQCVMCLSVRSKTPEYKEFKSRVGATPEAKASRAAYQKTDAGKQAIKRSQQKNRSKENERRKRWYAERPDFRLKALLRTRLNLAIQQDQVSAVRHLGLTVDEFKQYCENHPNWNPEWTWSDLGDKFQIDHIKALGLFDLTDPDQLCQAAHYTNLQPLSRIQHYIKTKQDIALIRAKKALHI